MNIRELRNQIKPYIEKDFQLDYSFSLGEENSFTATNGVIKLTLKRSNKDDSLSFAYAQQIYKGIVKTLNPDILEKPDFNSVGYKDALRLLFHHYPYSNDNNSNAILISDTGNIIAVANNGQKDNRTIRYVSSIEHNNIVYRNKDGLYRAIEGTFKLSQLNSLYREYK